MATDWASIFKPYTATSTGAKVGNLTTPAKPAVVPTPAPTAPPPITTTPVIKPKVPTIDKNGQILYMDADVVASWQGGQQRYTDGTATGRVQATPEEAAAYEAKRNTPGFYDAAGTGITQNVYDPNAVRYTAPKTTVDGINPATGMPYAIEGMYDAYVNSYAGGGSMLTAEQWMKTKGINMDSTGVVDYSKTPFDPDTDYSTIIDDMIKANPNDPRIIDLVMQRGAKILSDPALTEKWGASQKEYEAKYLNAFSNTLGTSEGLPYIEDTYTGAPLYSGSQLGNQYGITYDFDTIRRIYEGATNAAYDERYNQQDRIEQGAYNQLGANQSTVLDTLKKGNLSAISAGATKGMQAASQLAAVLGLSQQGVDTTTQLAQDRGALADKQATDLAAMVQQALTDSNMNAATLGKLANDLYGYDTSAYVAGLGADSQKYASDKAYDSQVYASDAATKVQESINAANARVSAAYGANSSSPAVTTDLKNQFATMIPGWESLDSQLQQDIALAYNFGATYEELVKLIKGAGLPPKVQSAVENGFLGILGVEVNKNPAISPGTADVINSSPNNWRQLDVGTWQNIITSEVRTDQRWNPGIKTTQ